MARFVIRLKGARYPGANLSADFLAALREDRGEWRTALAYRIGATHRERGNLRVGFAVTRRLLRLRTPGGVLVRFLGDRTKITRQRVHTVD